MKDVQFYDLDEKLLWELSRNARTPNARLAERLGVSQATIHYRLSRLRETGVWQSSHAELDPSLLGFHVQALISVRLKPQARAELQTYMRSAAQIANTVSVYTLSGPVDCLVHVYCVSTNQLRDFVTEHFTLDPRVAYADAQDASMIVKS